MRGFFSKPLYILLAMGPLPSVLHRFSLLFVGRRPLLTGVDARPT